MSNKKKKDIKLRVFNSNDNPAKTTFEETIEIEYSLEQVFESIAQLEKRIADRKKEIEANKALITVDEARLKEYQDRLEHKEMKPVVKKLEEYEKNKPLKAEDVIDKLNSDEGKSGDETK